MNDDDHHGVDIDNDNGFMDGLPHGETDPDLGSRVGECAYGDLPAYVGVGCLRRCLRRWP